jgi:hypothetical protein
MWPIVRAMQDIFVERRFPEWSTLAYPLAMAIAFAVLARFRLRAARQRARGRALTMGQLRVRDLGKAYKRYARKRGRLLEWLGAAKQHDLRWVLRDVSFDVEPGEAVGIVGANGAGKSTLLKLVAGITPPHFGLGPGAGSVSALLELGIGFHPDFTGRQNVYMAGSIRGLPPEHIARLMRTSRRSRKSATTSTSRCAPTRAACRCASPSASPPPCARTS